MKYQVMNKQEFRYELVKQLDRSPLTRKDGYKTRASYQYKGRNVMHFDSNNNLILYRWFDIEKLAIKQDLEVRLKGYAQYYSVDVYSNHLIMLIILFVNRLVHYKKRY